jgi:primosomal protein N' (replication factor Y)
MGFAECIEVALPVPVDATFRYGVPERYRAQVRAGCRVVVPFGARRLTGVITEAGELAPLDAAPPAPGQTSLFSETRLHAALRPLERVVDAQPVLSDELLRILRECAAEVFCPIGIALAAALPGAGAPRARRAFALSAQGRDALARGVLHEGLERLFSTLKAGPRGARALAALGGDPPLLRRLVREGLLVEIQLESSPPGVPALRVASLCPGVSPGAHRDALSRAPRQAELLAWLAEAGPTPVPELAARSPGARAALAALENKGLVEIRAVRRKRRAASRALAAGSGPEQLPTLTPEQGAAQSEIRAALEAGRHEGFLLHGVTGSGKTEVYLRAIAETLGMGRQALVLVPEITLTHQLVARLEDRFGDRVAVLHSALGAGERIGEWHRLREGRTPIAVGARSALFAPLERIGLIVVDEEHDSAYKNEEGFRYHAVDLAKRRAAANACPLILGSATPSLETRYAAERGELRRLVLPRRVGGRPLPRVELVDLEAERATLPRGRKLVLSRVLHRAIGETLKDGAQSILFLNRRGFSTRIFCFDCGHAERCRHCDVSLVYHAPERVLRCHYCDHERDPPEHCSACGAPDTALLGIGTQRLEEEVRRAFPAARIARLDRDNSSRKGATEAILESLSRGTLDILIGTQMVAKGHDFPGVRLVGVIAADLALHHPDFRAAERTFQLLTQVAGRAGRGAAPGRVVVQTFVPSHYAIRCAAGHDYEAFYREEMRHRSALAYPPHAQLLRVLVSAPEAEAARGAAQELAAQVPTERPLDTQSDPGEMRPALEVLGPAPAPLSRLRDRERFHFLVKGRDAKQLREVGSALARAGRELERGALRVSVDAFPLNML